VTTPDRHTDLNPRPASTDHHEQAQARSDLQAERPAETHTHPDTANRDTHATETSAARTGGRDEPGGNNEPLISHQQSAAYAERWDQVKGSFVDEPRQAVAAADQLVSELLEELQTLFRSQRHDIEQSLDADETSTEDLRVALRRYRSFFDRLLSV
jgi:hypothetical protein